MRIGILGAGQMAEALGAGWVRAGHDVMVGGRSPDRVDPLAAGIGAQCGGLREAAEFGVVTLLAVPAAGVPEALRHAGALDGALAGRPLIDCTNAFAAGAFDDPPGSVVLAVDGFAERVAQLAVGAQVVKAFNVCAAEVWRAGGPADGGRKLAVPVCGDDPHAVAAVAGLVADLGFQPLAAGGLARARYLEATAVFAIGLWFGGHDARAMLPPLAAAVG
ncbi:NAD(P)-binding domain-containing protein [Planosporangium thailandense]|uniref:NAD(P)-binding domain-containing protein n=1 Tax=Planosporangium thailandense TaxID=765197 RepID=A0ABX0Y174_9ACTN|nr:NAD(P)-binding domain-containing protein [Planosporangium thailandense]NJC71199.1 NAD(P)-binding domain-containing protein [Planosporangium thailandense]